VVQLYSLYLIIIHMERTPVSESSIEKLLKLQEKDQLIKRLETEASEIPRRKKKFLSTLDAQRILVENATDSHMRLQTEIKDIELDVELSREKINRYKKQQMEVKDNESYRALDNEIRGLTRHIRRQEDGQIEIMEKGETAKADLDVHKAELDRQIQEVGSEEAGLDAREVKLTAQINTHREDISALREGIDEDWLDRYDRTFAHKGDVALVTSNGGTCGGCNMKIPPALVIDSKTEDNITTCNYCGRMLYFAV